MASNKKEKAAIAQQMKWKQVELDEVLYFRLLKSHIQMKALRRGGVENWDGYSEALNEEYDDECISKLPKELLD